MRFLLYSAGVKTAFISTACNRNFSTVLGCKLNTIPTTGILHGFASRSYNVYDFMPTFNGEKSLSVDMYGLWSDWWVEYYVKNSRAYRKDQLCVSGLMRPLIANDLPQGKAEMHQDNTIRVLLVSEIVAVPSEIVPYIDAVNNVGEYTLYIKFRPRNDSFETWLHEHRPDIIDRLGNDKILKGSMQEAIKDADIVIGSQSTGVIEAVLQDKPFVLFNTKKWGDYYDMESLGSQYALFAKTPEDLVQYIRKGKDVPVDVLRTLKEKFFGDPYKNGSKWVVDRLESVKQQ